MKIRIVSDLHVDVNNTMDFGFLKDKPDLLIIAGDTAGSCRKEKEFYSILSKNNIKTISVGGNHLGYDYYEIRRVNKLFDIDIPLQETKEYCIKELKNNKDCTFLENNYVEFNNIIIYGGTMYSDFLLYGKNQKDNCKKTAERWLNDFRYVTTYDKKQKVVRPVTADDYEKWFKTFKRNLNKCIKETNKDIVVVSHFAPSINSIEGKYLNRENRFSSPGSELNAVYAVNLEDFIKQNPRIKIWAHGHVHSTHDYYIGQCRVVCNPYGYFGYETTLESKDYFGKQLELDIDSQGQITGIHG